MTGRELIDLIQSTGDLDKPIYIKDGNGGLFNAIKGVDLELKRDPYDGYWDEWVIGIELDNNCVIKEGE